MDSDQGSKTLTNTFGALFVILFVLFFPSLYNDLDVNSTAYKETRCVIVGSEIKKSSGRYPTYTPSVQLVYVIDDQPYTSWTAASRVHSTYYLYELYFGDGMSRLLARKANLPVGMTIPCWYNINDKNIVVTGKGYHVREIVILLYLLYTWMMCVVSRFVTISPPYKTGFNILNAIFFVVVIYAFLWW